MSVKDVIKGSIYEQFGGGTELSSRTIILLFAVAALIGVYIFCVYKNQSKSAFYSKDINMTIAGLPVIICAIMIAMQSNLIVSLGMVGALSIVRFRNAVKNPLDLLYFFWSISAGIICGVRLTVLAIFLCVFMTAMIFVLQLIPNARASSIIVLRTSQKNVDWIAVSEILKRHGKNVREKSRSISAGQVELIYELTTEDEEMLVSELSGYEQLEQINLLSHDGEYRV